MRRDSPEDSLQFPTEEAVSPEILKTVLNLGSEPKNDVPLRPDTYHRGVQVHSSFSTNYGLFHRGRLPNGEGVIVKDIGTHSLHGGHTELAGLQENRDNPYTIRYRAGYVNCETLNPEDAQDDTGSAHISVVTEEVFPGATLEYIAERINTVLNRTERLRLTAAFGLQAAAGLHLCHTNTIPRLHRDIKPENLLLAYPTRERGFLRIADFGLASPDEKYEPELFRDEYQNNQSWGTPGYMAPEIPISSCCYNYMYTERSDIYGLGMTLFTILNGGVNPYHESDDAIEMVTRQKREPVPLDLLTKRYGKSPLISIIGQSCSRAPRERQKTMLEVASSLYSYLAPRTPALLPHCGPAGREDFYR